MVPQNSTMTANVAIDFINDMSEVSSQGILKAIEAIN